MKTLGYATFFLTLMAVFSPLQGYGQAIHFNSGGSIDYLFATDEYLLTIPEIQVGDIQGWVRWKLNLANGAAWEIHSLGLTSDIQGQTNANGKYIYDPQRQVLVMGVMNSDYRGCGLERGTLVLFVSTLTTAEMTGYDPLEQDSEPVTCSRTGGTGSGITGAWNCPVGPNTFNFTFNQDGTFSFTGTIVQCILD